MIMESWEPKKMSSEDNETNGRQDDEEDDEDRELEEETEDESEEHVSEETINICVQVFIEQARTCLPSCLQRSLTFSRNP